MKRIFPILFAVAIAATTLPILAADKHDHDQPKPAAKEQLYTCGMHPQVIQNTPGNCPICGMKLTLMQRSADGGSGIHTIVIDPATIQNMGFRSELVARGPLSRNIRTVGTIDFDETKLAEVTTKFDGWIEKLNVDSVGAQVHRGDPLFEIYAPELYAAQVEYALALNISTNVSAATDTLKSAARAKLKFFDVSDADIDALEQSGQPRRTLPIASPADGFVIEKMVVQGQKVEAGMKLYRIADLGLVWVQAQIYEQDLPFVKLGQEAEVSLSYLPDRKFRGRVTYIYPTVDDRTRTAKVRMEFHNPGYLLKPGMFTTVQLRAELEADALLVTDTAVLRSGEKNTVFVALDGGKFEPRTVTLGPRGEGDVYQVFSGLEEGDRVVTSGQFMLDSESQLREAIQKMLNPQTAASNQSPSVEADTTQSAPLPTLYTCPMASHAHIVTDKPGLCPECEMTLVETSTVKHRKQAEDNWRKKATTGHEH